MPRVLRRPVECHHSFFSRYPSLRLEVSLRLSLRHPVVKRPTRSVMEKLSRLQCSSWRCGLDPNGLRHKPPRTRACECQVVALNGFDCASGFYPVSNHKRPYELDCSGFEGLNPGRRHRFACSITYSYLSPCTLYPSSEYREAVLAATLAALAMTPLHVVDKPHTVRSTGRAGVLRIRCIWRIRPRTLDGFRCVWGGADRAVYISVEGGTIGP